MEDSKLSELRNKIDAIDAELLAQLTKRAALVQEVGKLKHESGCSGNFIRSGREAKMLRELLEKGAGEFPKPAIKALWRLIISASLGLENELKISLPQNLPFAQAKTVIEYFGSFTKYKQHEFDDEVIESIDKNTVGVLTLETGWWLSLAEEKNRNLKIFAKLDDGVFAFAKLETEESGNDVTLAITHIDKHAGHRIADHGKVKLVEVTGFHREIEDMVVIGHYGN